MEKLQYKIEVFEGPLDLLLALIAKNKLDISDIPIAELLDQYMEQINIMQENDLDVSSEFLTMAARLVYLKSLSLLPKHEEEEELRMELTGQLLEYQQCKEVAAMLGEMADFSKLTRNPENITFDREYSRIHMPEELLSALVSALGKGRSKLPPKPESFSELVSKKIVSVTSQVVFLLRRLWKSKVIPYKQLFLEKRERSERVAAFLAILELIKKRRIRVDGDGDDSKIRLLDGGDSR